jgi:hypothetical protein
MSKLEGRARCPSQPLPSEARDRRRNGPRACRISVGSARQTNAGFPGWSAVPKLAGHALDRFAVPGEISPVTKTANSVAFMRKILLVPPLLATGVMCWLPAFVSLGDETNSTAAGGASMTQTLGTPAAAPQKLPYGVEDVVKLSRAQIGDDVILNYIRNTGTIYNLAPADIVYLRNTGVSDRVLNAMLDQGRRVPVASQSAPVAPGIPNATAIPDANVVPVAPAYAAPTYTYSAPTYTASAPTYSYVQPTAPASSLYVIPYPTPPGPAYYSYYGYPYSYYYRPYYNRGYYGPGLSFGFSFGGGGHGGGYGGGHGGPHH